MNTATNHTVIARLTALTSLITRRQDRLSSHVHAAGDQAAHRHGWAVTETRGPFGFGGRIYRDPRFATRPGLAHSAGRAPVGQSATRAR